MSFFSGNRQGCNPGPITGNPLQGLCEKACIQTRKVFDACMKQVQMDGTSVTLTNQQPQSPTAPLPFVSCQTQTNDVTITNLVVAEQELLQFLLMLFCMCHNHLLYLIK